MQVPSVLVLGAGGPVGRAIMTALQAHPSLTPIAALRRPPAARTAYEIRIADATKAQELAAAMRGCTYAVNTVGGPPATLRAATSAICQAAREAGLRRLVHISSMAVYGSGATGIVDEASPFAADPNAYEAAKIASEAAIAAYIEGGGSAAILRAGVVFGPHSTQWNARIARLLRSGRLGDLGAAGDGFCNLTHEADLGAAAIAALLKPAAENQAINVASANPPDWNAFLVGFGRALGATPVRRIARRRLALEAKLLAPVLQIGKIAAARAGLPAALLPDPVPPSLLRLFAQRMRADPTAADRMLGIQRTPDDAAIAAAAQAFA